MRKRGWIRWGGIALALAIVLMNAPSVFAKKDGGGGMPGGFGKGEKKGWEGEVPPGWSQGEKKGWGDSEMPPGLAKKSGEGKGKGKAKSKKGKKKN